MQFSWQYDVSASALTFTPCRSALKLHQAKYFYSIWFIFFIYIIVDIVFYFDILYSKLRHLLKELLCLHMKLIQLRRN